MIPEYECCPNCRAQRMVGYYEDNVYSSIRSTCTCMNTLGKRFTTPGYQDRIRRRDERNVILEVRPALSGLVDKRSQIKSSALGDHHLPQVADLRNSVRHVVEAIVVDLAAFHFFPTQRR